MEADVQWVVWGHNGGPFKLRFNCPLVSVVFGGLPPAATCTLDVGHGCWLSVYYPNPTFVLNTRVLMYAVLTVKDNACSKGEM